MNKTTKLFIILIISLCILFIVNNINKPTKKEIKPQKTVKTTTVKTNTTKKPMSPKKRELLLKHCDTELTRLNKEKQEILKMGNASKSGRDMELKRIEREIEFYKKRKLRLMQ